MRRKQPRPPERFAKQSPRLIYEELPAPVGCGGVVMRWRDPRSALPVRVHLYCPVPAKLFLDGAPIETTSIDVAPGPHLFAVETDPLDFSGGLFMFAAFHDATEVIKTMPPGVREAGWKVTSSPGGMWRATTEPPIVHDVPWTSLDFEDGSWTPLNRSVARPRQDWRMHGAFAAHICISHEADFLALPKGTKGRGSLWARARVNVPERKLA
jgi:hypothetical protein